MFKEIDATRSLAAALALPPPMSSVAHLVPGIRDRVRLSLSDEFLAQLEIQSYAIRAAAVLTNQNFNGLQRSLTEILEGDLDALETRIPTQTHLRVHIGILAARLRLCAIPMLSGVSSTTEEQGLDTWSRAVWYKGFHTSIQLVNLFAASTLPGDSTSLNDDQKVITIYCPKNYFYILVTAGMYFINLLAIDGDISTNNRVLAQNHIKMVYEILGHWSRGGRDELSRAAAVIDLLSRHVDAQDPSKLQETSNTMPTTSVITNGLKMVDKLRNRGPKPASRLRIDVSSPQVSDWPDFPGGFEQGFLGDDLLEWNTLFANMDGITSLFHTPLPTPGDKPDMNT
jgi:hypothetical protein